MSPEPSTIDQAVARALRANLQGVQRQSEELHQAIADLVAACSSNRPANALPHLLRAETCAASLAAVLEVLAKFVTQSTASQPARRHQEAATPKSAAQSIAASEDAIEPGPGPKREPTNDFAASPSPVAAGEPEVAPVATIDQSRTQLTQDWQPESGKNPQSETLEQPETAPLEPQASTHAEAETVASQASAKVEEVAQTTQTNGPLPIETFTSAPNTPEAVGVEASDSDSGHNGHIAGSSIAEAMGFTATQATPDASLEQSAAFDIAVLPAEQQELHRRANRVAKVSMQDIQLLRPDQVIQGRLTKDICIRLKDEIEKARREYERRFRSILGHDVDYFYHWMVEVLGAGDPKALGEYPYHSPVLRH